LDHEGDDIGIVLDVQDQKALVWARGMRQDIQYPSICYRHRAVSEGDPVSGSLCLERPFLFDVPVKLSHLSYCMDNVGLVKTFSRSRASYCQIWCLRLVGHAAIWSGKEVGAARVGPAV